MRTIEGADSTAVFSKPQTDSPLEDQQLISASAIEETIV